MRRGGVEEPHAAHELALELAGAPSGIAKAEADVRAVGGAHRFLQELHVAAEEDAGADLEGLIGDLVGRVEEHHLVGLEGAAGADLDVGIRDLFEVEDLFRDLDVEGLVDHHAKRAGRAVLAEEDDPAEVDARVDIGAGDEQGAFREVRVGDDIAHYSVTACVSCSL